MCRSYLNRARATETLRVGCNHCGSVVIALYDSFRRSALYERHVFSRTYVSMHLRHMNRHSVSCVGSSLRSAMAESEETSSKTLLLPPPPSDTTPAP